MKLQGVHHVSINVRDVEEAANFYTKMLGLEVIHRPDLGFPGAWLRCGDQELHLVGMENHQAPEGQHFAFRVDDLEAVLTELWGLGVRTSRARPIPEGGCHAFLRDPSGNLLELNQPLA
jgi:catechol 2,3-dioxygenase-like lactoylglutathione lyase family enzyme